MTTRTARFLLAGVVLVTAGLALRYYDGHDFINCIWAPIRGLVDGLNPYDPTASEYFLRYQVPVAAGLYVPAALTLHAPLALLSAERSADAMAALNVALVWLGVLLLIPPRTARACLVGGVAGALVIGSAAAQDTIYLGQLSGWAFAGLALVVWSLRRDPASVWLPAVGAAFVALKPQSGIPMLVVLLALGYRRVAGRALALIIVASLPGGLLFLRAAGSWPEIARTFKDNLTLLSSLPPTDLANPSNLRIDALGVISHLHGPALTGPVWVAVGFGVSTVLFVLAVRAGSARVGIPVILTDPYVMTLASVYILTSLYHLMYDQLPLYVGPLAAAASVASGATVDRQSRVVAAGGILLAVAGIVFREGMRARWVVLGLPELAVRQAWVTVPTLIGMGIVVWGLSAKVIRTPVPPPS